VVRSTRQEILMLNRKIDTVKHLKHIDIIMIRLCLLLVTLLAIPTALLAQQSEIFAVQIGTYEKFSINIKQSVKHFDDVHVFTYKNQSRVTVGEFIDRKDAEPLLRQLKKAGFKDAFIRRTGYVDLNKSHSTIEKFNILISELDAKAFYLDGDMFIFQGQGYIKIHHQDPDKISKAKSTAITRSNSNF